MANLEDVPQQPIMIAVALGRNHDLVDRIVVDVRHEEGVSLASPFQEGRLEYDAVLVAVDDLALVLMPSEGAVDEELDALGAEHREARHVLARVGDEVRAGFQGQTLLLQPLLELGRARKDADALARAQAMPRLLADDTSTVLAAVLQNRRGGHPQFVDLDPAFALVFGGMLEPEEVAGAAAMIVIQMGVADHVVVGALGGAQVGLEHLGEVDAGIPRVVGVPHVGVINQHFAAVRHVDARAVGISEGMKGQSRCHIVLSE